MARRPQLIVEQLARRAARPLSVVAKQGCGDFSGAFDPASPEPRHNAVQRRVTVYNGVVEHSEGSTHVVHAGAGGTERIGIAVHRIGVNAAGIQDHIAEKVGPYRLIRDLGRGRMSAVWLAERADGHIEREIALKLLVVADGA
jgi:hypothetical protein